MPLLWLGQLSADAIKVVWHTGCYNSLQSLKQEDSFCPHYLPKWGKISSSIEETESILIFKSIAYPFSYLRSSVIVTLNSIWRFLQYLMSLLGTLTSPDSHKSEYGSEVTVWSQTFRIGLETEWAQFSPKPWRHLSNYSDNCSKDNFWSLYLFFFYLNPSLNVSYTFLLRILLAIILSFWSYLFNDPGPLMALENNFQC